MLETLLIPLQYEYMLKAIFVSAVIGGVCAFLSCFITLKGWSLMGDALSHSVVPGVAVAYYIGWPFAAGAFLTGLLAAVGMGFVKTKTRLREDAVIGVVFTSFQGQLLWKFIQGARVELRKVVWPTREETIQTTLVVLIFALIGGVFFWLLDVILLFLTTAQTLAGTYAMSEVLPYRGGQALEVALLAVFAVLLFWISAGFWTAVMGFLLLAVGKDRFAITRGVDFSAPIDPAARTAVVMPICNEDVARVFAGLRATYESLERAGVLREEAFRRGNRKLILARNAQPLRRRLGARAFDRLLKALSLVYGIEPYVILKDMWGSSNREVGSITCWVADAVIEKSLREALPVAPTARSVSPRSDRAVTPRRAPRSPSPQPSSARGEGA